MCDIFNNNNVTNWEETICATFRKVISVRVIFKKYTSLACDLKNVHVANV
jgi:hypothetical protein